MANRQDQLQLLAAAEEVTVPMEADEGFVLRSITEKFGRDELEPRRDGYKPCTIYKVRDKIRSEDPEAYNPQIISIGPFHHGNKLLLPMERLKRQFTRDLIARHLSNSLPNYIASLSSASSVAEASSCYSEKVVDCDTINTFVEMMVIDGCFIIEFFVKSVLGEDMGELDFVHWNRSLAENDLLLLENQIPFSVLLSLFGSTVIPGITDTQYPVTLKELATSCLSRDRQYNVPPIPEVVHHLLHLRHSSLAPSPEPLSQYIPTKPYILLVLLQCCRPPPSEQNMRTPRMIPNATKLHKAGIKFRINKQSGSILDITFRAGDGVMEIPLLSVQAVTVSRFRNLVAFEQCYPAAGSYFTSYVSLMDNLIDTPEDVALLEQSGVLESKLSSDEEVCRFFNSLGKGAYLNYERHYLVGLFKAVNQYCGTVGLFKAVNQYCGTVGLFKAVNQYCGTDRHRFRARMKHD